MKKRTADLTEFALKLLKALKIAFRNPEKEKNNIKSEVIFKGSESNDL